MKRWAGARVPGGRTGQGWPTWLVALVVAVTYAVGVLVAFRIFNATTVGVLFLPAGVTLSALVLTERRQWPWVLAAAAVALTIVDLTHGVDPVTTVGFVVADTVEPLVGASLLRRRVPGPVDLRRRRDMLVFVSWCVLAAPGVGGVIGAATTSPARRRRRLAAFLPFWAGDALGVLTVGGAILTWRQLSPFTRRRAIELLLAVLATVAVTAVGFWPTNIPLFYLPIPLLF